MADLNIGTLRMNMRNAHGHEHRLRPIAEVAVGLFAARVEEHWPGEMSSGSLRLDAIGGQGVTLDLTSTNDHEAATLIADAWFDALVARLEGD